MCVCDFVCVCEDEGRRTEDSGESPRVENPVPPPPEDDASVAVGVGVDGGEKGAVVVGEIYVVERHLHGYGAWSVARTASAGCVVCVWLWVAVVAVVVVAVVVVAVLDVVLGVLRGSWWGGGGGRSGWRWCCCW